MKDERGDERWDLSCQEYKQHLYTCIAFAALGHKEIAIDFLRIAASDECHYRLQARTEYKNRHQHDKETLHQFVDGHISVLQLISDEVGIPRRHLDETYAFENDADDDDDDDFETPLDLVEDEDLWKCIQVFNSGVWSTQTVDYCSKCWVTAPTTKLKKCSQCHEVSYCCREHQLDDWKNHKLECAPKKSMQQTAKKKTEIIPE